MSDSVILILMGALSGLVSGITGFGSGLVLMGTLVAIMPVQQATVISAVVALAVAISNLWSVRGHIPWSEIKPSTIAAIPSVVAGVYLLASLDERVLRVALAAIILAGVAVALWSPRRRPYTRRWLAVGAGILSGLFNGALGTGGPPLVLLTLLRAWEKQTCKAYMSFMFLIMGVFRLILLVASGIATSAAIRQGLLVLVPVLGAWYLGAWIFDRCSTKSFRYAGAALLVVTAINSVWGL